MCSDRDKKSKKNPVILITTNCTTGNITSYKEERKYSVYKEKTNNYSQLQQVYEQS